jgi:ABC-type phosphonate transport system ATPase subunit
VAGNGRILFIAGEAGQGKTNLMAEFAHRAQADHPELVIAAGVRQALTGVADPFDLDTLLPAEGRHFVDALLN